MPRILKNQKNEDTIEKDGFFFTKKSKYSNRIIWRCKNRDCKANIKTSLNYQQELEEIILKGIHNHSPDENEVGLMVLRNKIKERAANSFDSPRIIVNSVLSGLPEREILMAGTQSSLSLLVNRTRSSVFPLEAQSIPEIRIPQYLRVTVRNELFYRYGPDILGYQNDNILIFAADSDVENLGNSAVWSIDGTFQTSPDLFYQLFTIAYIEEKHVFPSIYVLLPNKRESMYINM